MASRSKKKTTRAKLTRESRLRERRLEKEARKKARKEAAADHPRGAGEALTGDFDDSLAAGAGRPDVQPVTQAFTGV